MSLWVDKHRPKRLAKLDYHKDQVIIKYTVVDFCFEIMFLS